MGIYKLRVLRKGQKNTKQLLSLKLTHIDSGQEINVTLIYASNERVGKVKLLGDLYDI